jgi:4-oxalmesaconate hydratase
VIIDCHGHYTTAPLEMKADDEIRESIEPHQLRLMRERGEDFMLFSPKASAMAHHRTDETVARDWARFSNDLVHRVTQLFPDSFAGVCQLPQTPGGPLAGSVREVRRCVEELGFVGCNLNPDPSGGFWASPPLTDPYWYPLYEVLTELDVPAMVHVSSSVNPAVDTLGGHYLNADTTVFMQLLRGDLFREFPGLRLVIPHGGGAVPYHWGRFEGLARRYGKPPLAEHLLGNVFFDTCVYHQPGFDLLTRVVPTENLLFAEEMLGAVRGDNPETGASWDDTLRYFDAADLTPEARHQIQEANVRRVYPRLAKVLP